MEPSPFSLEPLKGSFGLWLGVATCCCFTRRCPTFLINSALPLTPGGAGVPEQGANRPCPGRPLAARGQTDDRQ